MSAQGFAGPLEGLLTHLQRVEVAAPIVVGISLAIYLILRRRGNPPPEEGYVDLIEEGGATIHEGGSADEGGSQGVAGDEFSAIQSRALEVLRSKGALRPSPMAASVEGGHYPDIAGASSADVERLIRGFIERGLAFEGEVEFTAVSCPLCGSSAQVALISCRNCGSLRVREVKYYRHICGFIGPESAFGDGSALRCPHCRSSGDIEPSHVRYRCPDCGEELEEVNIAFKCGSCGALYDEGNMALKPFKRIEPSREAMAEYERVMRAVEAEVARLRREGYVVERPATLTGESGVVHSFEAAARRGGEVIAITSSLGEPLIQTLFKLGVARSDLKLNKIILVTAKPASQAEREFARSLGIEILEGS